jgi:hypothetical protein
MAEVGLVRFAQVALAVARETVPTYRTRFSKHQFTQPQLLTILLLLRYEDWTFREAEVRVAEHSDLRAALGLEAAPDHTTLYRFMRRLDASTLQQLLVAVVNRMPTAAAGAVVAVDATGLAPGAISTFVNRTRDSGEGFPWRQWLKWLVAVDGKRQLVLAQIAKRGPTNDSATLHPLVAMGQYVGAIDVVLADGEFDSERNHQFVRGVLGAESIIPARRGKASWEKRVSVRRWRRTSLRRHKGSGRWSRAFSPPRSGGCRHGRRAARWRRSGYRRSCWASRMTYTASGVHRLG